MSRLDEFTAHVCDLLQPLGPVVARRMFGGWGLYVDGVMFALIEQERLFLKADREAEARFADAGCQPFTYVARGQTIALSYFEAPDGSLEDPDDLLPWAELAVRAARRAKAEKATSRKRT